MKILNCTKFTPKGIADRFWQRYVRYCHSKSDPNLNRSDFYCGITNDLERRAEEHHVENFLICAKCSSFEVSSAAESLLAEKGFDCGEQSGNGTENSVYIYMYQKIPDVTEE